MKKGFMVLPIVTLMSIASGGVALAAPNPSGTGLPNQTCQTIEAQGGTVPGKSSASPGSVFNEPILNSPAGGTGGQAYNNAGAPSQYDVACYQVSQ